MQKFTVIFLILVSLGCSDQGSPKMTVLKAYPNASIEQDFPYVTSGSSLVLHYYYEAAQEDYIADDEFSEDFLVEIIVDGDEFTLSIDELMELNQLYRQYCFCGPINYSKVLSGTLEAEKMANGDWKVNGLITLELGYVDANTGETGITYEKELDLNGTFRSSDIPS